MDRQNLLTERFYAAFQKVQQLLRQKLNAHLQHDGLQLTRGQFFLLRVLYNRGPLMITELADWMNVRPATMSPIIDRLEKHQLVSRVKNEKDRRIVYVELTEGGRHLVLEMETIWRQVVTEHLSRLTEQEQELVIGLLEKFARKE
ncbi:MarR family winged helix-turn-helix transcriptional regulator [Paenibacillus hamazuiensis]|uniref:MarR family winged helix-turn-helix transcriptional regulator n=1 Tax=Paenibacillus hamazuiensis TaxID=2936508 RepID=UPI00200BE710|nr:MarR family transcriptional regulator [Paenibacillus hamazuiensis]